MLVVSEELDELFEISDQLIVIAQGRMSAPMVTREATVERIGSWMGGLFFRTVDAEADAQSGVGHAAT